MRDAPWDKIFNHFAIIDHDFKKGPFIITAQQIKEATKGFTNTNEREVRILCKQDTREERPEIFKKYNLFILPINNGTYAIIEGEGYVDIKEIEEDTKEYKYTLDFDLDTSKIGNSEMQHLDFAYASSIIRTFINDPSLVLTIRGRKYTPKFSFLAGDHKHEITVESVQTEVDAGYEGRDNVVLIEAKNSKTNNIIVRQLFYPFRQWKQYTKKTVIPVFFEKRNDLYLLWQFKFTDENNYNSIELVKSKKYKII